MSVTQSQYNIFQQLTSCRLTAPANVNAIYYNGSSNNGVGATFTSPIAAPLSIDGVLANKGDRILFANQTLSNTNGIYVVTEPGSASVNWIVQRSNDFQSIEQLKAGQFIPISSGNTLSGSIFLLVEPLPGTFSVDNIVFTNVSSIFSSTFQLKSSIRAQKYSYAGGSATIVINDNNILTASVVVAAIQSSANAVQIQKVTPASGPPGSITILCSGDPGASVISYIALSAVQ